MEWFNGLAKVFVNGEQRVDQREEQYDFFRVQANNPGDPRWWEGIGKQDDSADGRPDLGIYFRVFLPKGRLED